MMMWWLLACGWMSEPPEAAPEPEAEPVERRRPAKADRPRPERPSCVDLLVASNAPISQADPSCHTLGEGSIGAIAKGIRERSTSIDQNAEDGRCTVTLHADDGPTGSSTLWTFDVKARQLVAASLQCVVAG